MDMNLLEAIGVLFFSTLLQMTWKYESLYVWEDAFCFEKVIDKELAILIGLNSWILFFLFLLI